MNNSSNSQKKAILQEFIAEDDIYVCINSRDEGVVVPNTHKGNVDLRLILSLNFINKPSFEEDFVDVILLFGGIPRKCILPYKAIWGVFNSDLKRLFFWQEHMPAEVSTKIQEFQEKQGIKTNPFSKKVLPIQKKITHDASDTSFSAEKSRKEKKASFTVIENKSKKKSEKTPAKERSRTHLKVLK